ncbi:MAG: DUF1844 domain-containing protein [Verrucomicrobia bacterium]|jgi:hypothetical protein|nr:hypothetical protein [Roseibacillus sp.]MBB23499.1 hypothetical protein [Roseibacillus sp.]RCL39710.1 MAG: DUF1844 domain-containing protein [Verrucomicrobiota bacterium]RPF86050.1 MAG: DUF1844 domain-containing protein [Roseibacillus sp. TMED18]|tara:strand:- start:4427 stop:4702 length:276 start_codon:yes stop_codon:yes gene_type:complete
MENDQRFADFVILQAQNAGMFLGKVPNPVSGTLEVNAKAARSVLDSLEMLELKTTGNRTPQEDKLLQTALLNIRTLYSEVETQESNDPSQL